MTGTRAVSASSPLSSFALGGGADGAGGKGGAAGIVVAGAVEITSGLDELDAAQAASNLMYLASTPFVCSSSLRVTHVQSSSPVPVHVPQPVSQTRMNVSARPRNNLFAR